VLSHRGGTYLIFNREMHPDYFQDYIGAGSPEYDLMDNERVNATRFEDMASDKVLKMRYGIIAFWRMTALH
jgi:hypothetical protein